MNPGKNSQYPRILFKDPVAEWLCWLQT